LKENSQEHCSFRVHSLNESFRSAKVYDMYWQAGNVSPLTDWMAILM